MGGERIADAVDEADISQKRVYESRCAIVDLHAVDERLPGDTVSLTASQGLGEGYDGCPSRHIPERGCRCRQLARGVSVADHEGG